MGERESVNTQFVHILNAHTHSLWACTHKRKHLSTRRAAQRTIYLTIFKLPEKPPKPSRRARTRADSDNTDPEFSQPPDHPTRQNATHSRALRAQSALHTHSVLVVAVAAATAAKVKGRPARFERAP